MDVHTLLTQRIIPVQVKAGASQTTILGVRHKRLYIAVNAPAQDGKANAALCAYLSKLTGKTCVVHSGATATKKLIACT